MIGADLVRALVLVPVAIAGLSGHLPLAVLVAAAFVLTTATSYFDPAYGGLLPALVDRRNVQQANGARPRDGRRSLRRRLGARRPAADRAPDQRVLRAERGVVLPVRAPAGRRAREGTAAPGCRRGAAADPRGLRRPPAAAGARCVGRRARSRGHDLVGNVDRRRPGARALDARPRRGQLLARRGLVRARIDLRRRRAHALSRSGARRRRACWRGRSTCRRTAVRGRRLARGRARGRARRRRRAGLVVGADQLGRAGGGAGSLPRPRDRAHLARPPRRARHRPAPRLAALRRHVARERVRGRGGRDPADRADRAPASVDQAKLEHPRRVEAVDPEHRPGGGGGGARRHEPDELRARSTSAPRARASSSMRATISWSAAASQSSTFMLTWTRPTLGRSRPSARTPGKPPPDSRTAAATARAASSVAAQVDVERDQRAPGADEHAAGCVRRVALGP